MHDPVSPDTPIRTYAEVRSELRTGDLLLCAGSSVMSRLIQRFTSSRWSHVALIARLDDIDRLIVLESVESIGVRAVPLSHYLHNYNGGGRGYEGTLTLARHEAFGTVGRDRIRRMSQFATEVLGRRYDTTEVLRIAGRIMREPMSRDRNRDSCNAIRRNETYICSEFVWECFREAGLSVSYDPRGFIAPCDFAADLSIRPLWTIQSGEYPNSTPGYPQS